MLSGRQLLAIWSTFFLGVVIADVFLVHITFYVLSFCIILLCAILWRWRVGNPSSWLVVSLCVLAVLSGVARMEYAESVLEKERLPLDTQSTFSVTGIVAREPDVRETFQQLYVDDGQRALLVRTDRFTAISYGDVVNVVGTLEVPEVFETDTGRVFDYPNYLKVRGVQYVVSFAEVEVVTNDEGWMLMSAILHIKQQFAKSITSTLPSPQGDLGLGLLLGVKQALGEDLETAFRKTGLIHIVVLSGYNVMLVIAFFWWLSAWVFPLRGRVVFSLIGIVVFALMVGLSATVVRASIMAAILLLAKYIGTRYDVFRSLLCAGFLMVLINPYVLLYDLGFQLSFMATLALVLFMPQFEGTVATKTTSITLRDVFFATLVTQLFVLPLLVFYIGEVSLVAVLVNVLVLPMVSIAMGMTFVTGLVGMISSTFVIPFAWIAHIALSYIIVIVEWFSLLPWAAIVFPQISVVELFGLYALLFAGWYGMKQRNSFNKSGSSEISDEPLDTPIVFR